MKNTGAFIITGATGGLGSALAYEAVEAGFPVALIARSKANLASLKNTLQKWRPSAKVSIHAVDLRNESKTDKEIQKALKTHGAVRALINNAGTWMGTTSIEKVKASEIRDSLELNFFSAVNTSLSLIKATKKPRSSELAIINIGATSSMDAWPEVLPFCIAKGALRGFSRALAREMGPKGIHVAHCVIDGMLSAERTKKLNPSLKGNRFIQTAPLARSIVQIALQDKSCWTAEWDVRPHNENW